MEKGKVSKPLIIKITAILTIGIVVATVFILFYRLKAAVKNNVQLVEIATGLTSPVSLKFPNNESGRLFIVDQKGLIWILNSNEKYLGEPFLNLTSHILSLNSGYDERGLLDMAFHPNFSENGKFYVYYSAPLADDAPSTWDHTSYISEFQVLEDQSNKADITSERILLQVHQPQANHNGGQLLFGPDDHLYISLGDGGGANDQGRGHPHGGNGQNRSTLLGSILRIDVLHGDHYSIPLDNPFIGKQGKNEVFAYGFRNPFRMSFDPNGRLFVGDVGQNLWEEVDIVDKGKNYGWNLKEGTHCFDPENPTNPPTDCPSTGSYGQKLHNPILEYKNARVVGGVGRAVIGGHIYTGTLLNDFKGTYIFGDWNSANNKEKGLLFYATPPNETQENWSMNRLPLENREDGNVGAYLLGIGKDQEGELYALTSAHSGPSGSTGKVYKFVPAG